MMRAMYSGITGLKNFQLQMDVVGNNIANVNTTGFKASRVTFETTLLQTLKAGKSPENQYGGTNPMQVGLGSKISSVDKIFSQGSFQNTGKKTDLAIQGDGFFVLSDSQGNYFSRAGNFTLDSSGFLVNPSSGLKLQGWSAKIGTNGQRYVDTNEPIGDVKIAAGLVMPAKQTSFVNLAHNLNADVGVQETTMIVKSTLGKELPIKFKFVRDMRAEYKERNVYTWESELVNTGSPSYEFAKSNYDKTLKGSVELDNAGNVVKWSTFKNGMETMGVDTDSKLSIYDVSGNLRINRSNEAVDGSSAGMEIDFSAVTYDVASAATPAGLDASKQAVKFEFDGSATNTKVKVTVVEEGKEYSDTYELADNQVSTINAFFNGGTDVGGKTLIINGKQLKAAALISGAATDRVNINSITWPTMVDGTLAGTSGGTARDFSLAGGIKLTDTVKGQDIYYDPKNVKVTVTNAAGAIPGSVTVSLTTKDGVKNFTINGTVDAGVGKNVSYQQFNEAFSDGVKNGNLRITGLSLSNGQDTDELTATAATGVTFASVKNIIQPPSGGSPKFVDVNNPQNFVVAGYKAPTVAASTLVYDSLGQAYNVYLNFTKINENTWFWKAQMEDGTPLYKLNEDGTRDMTSFADGVIAFDGNGGIMSTNWRLREDGTIDTNTTDNNNGSLGFWFDPAKPGAAPNPTYNPSSISAAGPVMAQVKFQELTQFASPHSIAVTEQDGNSEGTLDSFAINEVGQIIGTFTNGKSDALGQVALAVFNNPAGLLELGNSLYAQSSNSGIPQIGTCGVGGRGTLLPGTLEMSNVDLAEEFTNMIIAQRGFQATSRIITTADQILNELVNIKR